ncbi:DNA gyrase inhibitor YacG [Uliginosibacterium gangwonense]|uniref:DNA gyrase inhibitor YacG n=1 Tax=Uliginosibacterium gangwonense TaxID=392736 RepID=UPI0003687C5B|nr:DNA gyrase inhibitor YacG [Uliginosibacterium gangwonense]
MTKQTVRVVACPQCGTNVEWRPESRYRPFCSERCKLIDIGAWASETYRVAGQEEPLSDEVPEQH